VEAISDLELGKAAEHLVVADLILSGYRAYLTEQGLPYDAVLDDNGRLYRIQVKASRDPKKMPQHGAVGTGYLYHVRRAGKGGSRLYGDDEFDILALVGMDIRVVAYLPFERRVLQSIYLRPPGQHNRVNAGRTRTIDQFPIENALTALTGRRPVLATKRQEIQGEPRDQGRLFETA
jgi:hypothetical protein